MVEIFPLVTVIGESGEMLVRESEVQKYLDAGCHLPGEKPKEPTTSADPIPLESASAIQLKARAEQLGIEGFGQMRRAGLIEALTNKGVTSV